jgi:hypothetical protein
MRDASQTSLLEKKGYQSSEDNMSWDCQRIVTFAPREAGFRDNVNTLSAWIYILYLNLEHQPCQFV